MISRRTNRHSSRFAKLQKYLTMMKPYCIGFDMQIFDVDLICIVIANIIVQNIIDARPTANRGPRCGAPLLFDRS